MQGFLKLRFKSAFLALYLIPQTCFGLDQIIRPYQSVRSAAMGGVRITTGLYDENFFNNPARVMANPESKFTLFQLTPVEFTSSDSSLISTLQNSQDFESAAAGLIGSNFHSRSQLIFPAYYLASNSDRNFALAFGIIAGLQADLALNQSYQTMDTALADVGVAFTFGHSFLPDSSLAVGTTFHFAYRAGVNPSYGLLDYIQGTPLTLNSAAGEGAMVDFDLGATYKILHFGAFDFNAGLAFQNILGGGYSNLPLKILSLKSAPVTQPTSMGLGLSLFAANLDPVLNLHDTTFALEATDFFNNRNGSFFKLLHLGLETHWKSIGMELGLNQGYWTAGLGFDFGFLTLNFATYGEELGLNTGELEDRRFTGSLGIHF